MDEETTVDNQLPHPDGGEVETNIIPVGCTDVLKYQWKPDLPDHRDTMFSAVLGSTVQTSALPKFVNILGIRNKIEDQGQIGSCTGNSSTTALEISIGTKRPFSRLMAYYTARELEGTTNQDAGATIRDVIKGLASTGVCYEETWPYDESKFAQRPPAKAYEEAKALVNRMWGFEYMRVNNLNELKAALALGYPVTFGFSCPEIFTNPRFNGFLRLPGARDRMSGGHAVVAVGYDDRVSEPYIWIRNSWGKQWGMNGYFKMTQDWFTSPYRLADDMWVIRRKGLEPNH
ncbi:C1 family peptidase [Acinetobacter sp.]|uniref:C1 family peptidase n=1 Tax=Acinetobacter sp. TaxID=472 RepID=UPI00388D16CB